MKSKIQFLVMMLLGILLSINQVWGSGSNRDLENGRFIDTGKIVSYVFPKCPLS